MTSPVVAGTQGMPATQWRLRRIVAGTDFSQASRQALKVAGDLAAMHGATLTIVHAVDPMITALEISPQVIIDDMRAGLQQAANEAKAAHADISVEMQMRMGRPWWAINESAMETAADLVVIASHGRGGLARMTLGSTADRVLRTCRIPVIMVPVDRSPASHQAKGEVRWSKGLVAIDFSEESIQAMHVAARLLGASPDRKVSLTLLHTVSLTIEFRGFDAPAALPEHWDQAEAAAAEQLEQLAHQVRSPNLDVRTRTHRGYAPDGILNEARSLCVDLIALGTHGRGAVNRVLLGSVAERVLHSAPCAILTVRHMAARSGMAEPAADKASSAVFRG